MVSCKRESPPPKKKKKKKESVNVFIYFILASHMLGAIEYKVAYLSGNA